MFTLPGQKRSDVAREMPGVGDSAEVYITQTDHLEKLIAWGLILINSHERLSK